MLENVLTYASSCVLLMSSSKLDSRYQEIFMTGCLTRNLPMFFPPALVVV